MNTESKKNISNEKQVEAEETRTNWQLKFLLVILCYEAAGCLAGDCLLLAKPDCSLMDMAVDLMHGAFLDFLIPGRILFGLEILNALAFISVIRKSVYDWFFSGFFQSPI